MLLQFHYRIKNDKARRQRNEMYESVELHIELYIHTYTYITLHCDGLQI